MRTIVGVTTAVLLAAATQSANATVFGSLGNSGGGPNLPLGSAGLDGGAVASLSGGAVVTGPIFPATTYLSAGAGSGQPAVLTFNVPTTYLSFLWGAPVGANRLVVASTGASQLFTAASLGFPIADGSVDFRQAVQFNALPGDFITSISFSNSTTVDSFAAGNFFAITRSIAPVPEPSAWTLMISGFGMVGAAMRRRRSAALGRTAGSA